MECVLLAGGRPREGETLWPETRGGPKALIDLGGQPMIQWVVDALLGSRHIERVVLVGLEPSDFAGGRDDQRVEFVPDQHEYVANIYAGIERLSGSGPAAFCWSDIPLVTPEMIDHFIDTTPDPALDVNAGMVTKDALNERYPGVDDLWLPVRGGKAIAADFGLFDPAATVRMRHQLEVLMPQRKRAVRQALSLGLPFVVKFVAGRVTLPALEAQVRRRFGIECHVRLVEHPELGLDVDNATNLEVCRKALAARRGQP